MLRLGPESLAELVQNEIQIFAGFGGGLQMLQIVLPGELLTPLGGHGSVRGQVQLVGDDDARDLAGALQQLPHPQAQVVVRRQVR